MPARDRAPREDSGSETAFRRRAVLALARSWRWLVAAALLGALVAGLGLGPLVATFRRISLVSASLVVALAAAWLFLGAMNVWILLRSLHPLPFRHFLPAYLHSWALSLVLPGQLGDATQVLLLRRHGVGVSASGAAYLLDKVFSFSWIVLVTLYGVGLFLPNLDRRWIVALPLLGGVVVALTVALILRWPMRSDSLPGRVRFHLEKLREQTRGLLRRPGVLSLNAGLTIAKWLVVSCMYWGAFEAFGSRIDLEAAATIPVMSSLVGYLPISVGGLGTMEWTAVGLFARIGEEGATVLSVYLFFRVTLLVLALAAMVSLAPTSQSRSESSR